MDTNRKKWFLAVLVALFSITLIYRIEHPFERRQVAQLTYTGGRGHAARIRVKAGRPRDRLSSMKNALLISFLKDPPVHSSKTHRNLFVDETGADVTADKVAEAKEDNSAPPEEVIATPSPTPQETIKAVLGDIKIFGYLKKNDQKMLFIERGKDIFMIKKGDHIDGHLEVQQISDQTLTIKAEALNETIHIDLTQLDSEN